MWYLLIYRETLKIPNANVNLRLVAQWAKGNFFGYITHLMHFCDTAWKFL